MLIYLDMCCLKRPFDDQTQPRIHLETEAVLSLLALESDLHQFVRSGALMLENSLNPVPERAARVQDWLSLAPLWQPGNNRDLESRTIALVNLGMRNFDALHVASAEMAAADAFVTTDDRLLKLATRHRDAIRTRVWSVIECAREISP